MMHFIHLKKKNPNPYKDCTTIKSRRWNLKFYPSKFFKRIDCGERIFFIIANSNTKWIGAEWLIIMQFKLCNLE